MFRAFIAAAALLLAPAAYAQSAEEMASNCKWARNADVEGEFVSIPRTPEANICWGAFSAIQALGQWRYKGDAIPVLHFCAPPKSTLLQYIKIFERYADTHPARLHEGYDRIAVAALQEAFPCAH
jgi:Ssp1 endopeptidase immunity protein Rap1a